MNERNRWLWKWSAFGACVFAGTIAIAQPGPGDPSMGARQCSANTVCGLTTINCNSVQDACCCTTAPAAAVCGCHDASYCTSPPSGTTCDSTP